jgi:hypothetical protein
MSRQSDSNRRPADYKSAALNQLSYAGISLGKLPQRKTLSTLASRQHVNAERNLAGRALWFGPPVKWRG